MTKQTDPTLEYARPLHDPPTKTQGYARRDLGVLGLLVCVLCPLWFAGAIFIAFYSRGHSVAVLVIVLASPPLLALILGLKSACRRQATLYERVTGIIACFGALFWLLWLGRALKAH
jgi:hypothetical protein